MGGDLEDADDRYVLTIELEKKGHRATVGPKVSSAKQRLEKKTHKVTIPEVGSVFLCFNILPTTSAFFLNINFIFGVIGASSDFLTNQHICGC